MPISPKFLAAAGLALLLAGCRAEPLQNIEASAFGPATAERQLTLEETRDAIIRGGARRGWTFEEEGPGRLTGNIAVRGKHFAVVDVEYDAEQFSIRHQNSSNLDYDPDGPFIHPNYNSWVRNLAQDIREEVTLEMTK
ncbi:MAG: hypothetical protein AAF568_12555 [Pseudomonadota bacterium]